MTDSIGSSPVEVIHSGTVSLGGDEWTRIDVPLSEDDIGPGESLLVTLGPTSGFEGQCHHTDTNTGSVGLQYALDKNNFGSIDLEIQNETKYEGEANYIILKISA